jgi:hypothetical protein
MPTPSTWTVGVAAPSVTDPYSLQEGAIPPGAVTVPNYAGAPTAPATAKIGGSWKDAFNPHEPAFWLLAAVLIGIGVLHLGGGVSVGGSAGVGLEA